jgi:hypothetical protein
VTLAVVCLVEEIDHRGGRVKLQIPPLRFASVGMTEFLLGERNCTPFASVGMTEFSGVGLCGHGDNTHANMPSSICTNICSTRRPPVSVDII